MNGLPRSTTLLTSTSTLRFPSPFCLYAGSATLLSLRYVFNYLLCTQNGLMTSQTIKFRYQSMGYYLHMLSEGVGSTWLADNYTNGSRFLCRPRMASSGTKLYFISERSLQSICTKTAWIENERTGDCTKLGRLHKRVSLSCEPSS